MQRIKLQPAFVLHTRPYRDTSLLVDLVTMHYGRIHTIARSARGPRSHYKGILQPFTPLLISWSGKTDLLTLGAVELAAAHYELSGRGLLSAFYLNELLVRLLHFNDAHPTMYEAYERTLIDLQRQKNPEIPLRLFEKTLLLELGYGLQLQQEALTGEFIDPDVYYWFNPQVGLLRHHGDKQANTNLFLGKHLLAFYNEQLSDSEVLRAAKQLMRLALAPLLSNKPVKSRELF